MTQLRFRFNAEVRIKRVFDLSVVRSIRYGREAVIRCISEPADVAFLKQALRKNSFCDRRGQLHLASQTTLTLLAAIKKAT